MLSVIQSILDVFIVSVLAVRPSADPRQVRGQNSALPEPYPAPQAFGRIARPGIRRATILGAKAFNSATQHLGVGPGENRDMATFQPFRTAVFLGLGMGDPGSGRWARRWAAAVPQTRSGRLVLS